MSCVNMCKVCQTVAEPWRLHDFQHHVHVPQHAHNDLQLHHFTSRRSHLKLLFVDLLSVEFQPKFHRVVTARLRIAEL